MNSTVVDELLNVLKGEMVSQDESLIGSIQILREATSPRKEDH